MKKKIILGSLFALIIIVCCYIVTGIGIYNYDVSHPTYNSDTINCINDAINMISNTTDENDFKSSGKTISQKELINYLEDKKAHSKIKKYIYDNDGVTIEFLNGAKMYCNRYIKGFQSGISTTLKETIDKQQISSSVDTLSVMTAQPYASDKDMSTNTFDNTANLIANSNLGYKFTDNVDNQNVTVEFMKNLSNYKVIIFDGHGVFSSKNKKFIGVALGEFFNDDNYNNYIDDITAGRLAFTGDYRYVVTSAFFDYYYKDNSFNDSLLYFGCCEVANDDSDFSRTLINKGAKAVLAYKNNVFNTYNRNMCQTIFSELVKKDGNTNSTKTVAQALETAKEIHGERDTDYTNWYDFVLYPFLKEYVKKSNRAELVLTEKDDKSFRLVDENNDDSNDIDYVKIYHEFIGGNLNTIDYEKILSDENSAGIFSALIKDFDNDNVKELVTFSYENENYTGNVKLNLYKYLDDKVIQCDTSDEIYADGAGVWLMNMCGIYEDDVIKVQSDGYSYGGSYHYSIYMSYEVKDNKLVKLNDYSLYEVPRYEKFEYKESVIGKTYSDADKWTEAVISSGYDVSSHLHVGYSSSKFVPGIDSYKNNDLFKGNHIFTFVNSKDMITSGEYGFINDNTGLIDD